MPRRNRLLLVAALVGIFVLMSVSAAFALGDEPGEGVNLDGPDIPPGPVTIWPDDKAERALGTVTFN